MYIADFKTWIPKEAISSLKEIQRFPDLEKDDFSFLMPLLEDESMKSFYNLVKNKDRFFFLDLFYPLLVARKDFIKRQNKHTEGLLLQDNIKSLKNQIKKMRKNIEDVLKAKHHATYLFEKFPALLNELETYTTSLDKEIKDQRKFKNPHRPLNRKGLNKCDDSKKNNLVEAHYYARYLIKLFDTQSHLPIKEIQIKKIICDMISALINVQLNPKDLDDLKRNS